MSGTLQWVRILQLSAPCLPTAGHRAGAAPGPAHAAEQPFGRAARPGQQGRCAGGRQRCSRTGAARVSHRICQTGEGSAEESSQLSLHPCSYSCRQGMHPRTHVQACIRAVSSALSRTIDFVLTLVQRRWRRMQIWASTERRTPLWKRPDGRTPSFAVTKEYKSLATQLTAYLQGRPK